MILNTFISDNSNIAYFKTQHHQIMARITYKILKFETMIKKPLVTNHAFFAVITFSNISSLAEISSSVIRHL